MKKCGIIIGLVVLLTPSLVFSNTVNIRFGFFIPSAQSDLWKDEFDTMNFGRSNFQNINLGFSYEFFLTRNLSFSLGVDSYYKGKSGQYRDYVGLEFVEGEFAFPPDYVADFIPGHSLSLSMYPISLSFKILPLGRINRFIPYIGGGATVIYWSVRIQGDWVNMNEVWYYYDPDLDQDVEIYPIYYADARDDDKFAFGFHGFAGFMFPLANRITFDVEVRYMHAKGNLTEGFEGFEPFDLGGFQLTLGMNYWF
ncbi:MAG: hypothetical protein JXB26_07465 [Candidatus Aminicenantes bacterium]|nr:hypothetical protein [Candidatus Aminicenantes bacterium]